MVGIGVSFNQMTVEGLEALIRGIGMEPNGGKKQLLEQLDGYMDECLSSNTVNELKDLADKYSLDITGKRKKQEILDAIQSAITPEIFPNIFDVKKEETLEEIGEELVDIEHDVEDTLKTIEGIHTPEMADLYETDKKLQEIIKQNVNYAPVGELLDLGRVKYMDGRLVEAIGMLAEATRASKQFFEQYQDITYAFLLMASEKILVECRDAESNDEKAADVLIDAKRAFSAGGARRAEATEALIDIANEVYREQVELIEEQMDRREGVIKAMKIQGVDVFNAERYVHRAREAFLAGEMSSAMANLQKALNHANESKASWIKEIEGDVPRVERIIQQAKELGADVTEAEKSMNQAKVALENNDYSLCSELTKLAERKAMESQQSQIQKAAQLEREKLGDAQQILAVISPLVQEAQLYNLDIQDISWSMNAAREAHKNNDYVNALTYARQAEAKSRTLVPRLEVERERILATEGEFRNCQICKAQAVKIFDSGWARCMSCGQMFQVMDADRDRKKKWGLFGR